MVQGLPAIDWKNGQNNAKLFAALLDQLKNPDTKKIAAVFGPNIPSSAISYRINVLRKGGSALDVQVPTPAKTNGAAKPTPRAPHTSKRPIPKGKRNKGGKMLSKDSDDDTDTLMDSEEERSAPEMNHGKTPSTPDQPAPAQRQKTQGGRITKRVSPRQKSKETNYKSLEDPFLAMESAKDENGNNIFGEPSGTESEDDYASDGSFKGVERDDAVAAVKTEDVVAV